MISILKHLSVKLLAVLFLVGYIPDVRSQSDSLHNVLSTTEER